MQIRSAGRGEGLSALHSTQVEGAALLTELYLVGMILVLIIGYLVSLWLNPWVKCPRCGGGTRKKGFVFGYAYHACPKCKGTGRKLRFGRRFSSGRLSDLMPPVPFDWSQSTTSSCARWQDGE